MSGCAGEAGQRCCRHGRTTGHRPGTDRDLIAAKDETIGVLRAEVDRLHRDHEHVSIGLGAAAGVLAGLIGWFLTESTGWAVVIGLLVETSVWLWFRWVA